jgi:hypothetical protein
MKITPARTKLAAELHTILSNDVGVIDHLPDSIAPPCVLIGWAEPWIKATTWCDYQATMEILVVAQRLEPGGKLELLEEIVAEILPALKGLTDYQVVDCTAPYPIQIGGVDYLAATINITSDLE